MGQAEVFVFFVTTVRCYHFIPQVSFYTPWKHEKVWDFQMFSGVIEETSDIKRVNKKLNKFSLAEYVYMKA